MKRLLSLLALVLFGCGTSSTLNPNVSHPAHGTSTTPRVVFFGDSTMTAWISQETSTYPLWTNAGAAPGTQETTDQELARFPAAISSHPDVVFIMAGMWDMAQTTWNPPCGSDTCNNIVSMITLAHNAGIKVLIGSVPVTIQGSAGTPLLTANPDMQGNQSLFNRNLGLVVGYWQEDGLVDLADALVSCGDSSWTDDGVDVNACGAMDLTITVYPAIEKLHVGYNR